MPETDQHKIVLLETDRSRRDYLHAMITGWGYLPFIFESETNCLANLMPLDPDLVISGSLTTEKALRFINSLKMIKTNLPVLFITKDDAVQDLIDTNGFSNVCIVGVRTAPADIRSAIRRSLNTGNIAEEINGPVIIGNSPAIIRIKKLIPKLNRSNEVVLLLGETGTGKELVARAIHNRSPRRDFPFVKVNAVELPYRLLEGKLFGYSPTALQDIPRSNNGMFSHADNGTIFIKEIGALPIFLQVKLLQFLEKTPQSVEGSDSGETIDVRIIASTALNLPQMVKKGEFRTDLYHRLNVIRIHIPPLRRRRDDIVPLTDFFMDKYCLEYNKSRFQITPKTRAALNHYHWPENVRELERLIRRAVLQGSENGMTQRLCCGPGNDNRNAARDNRTDDVYALAGLSDIRKYLRETNNFSLKGVGHEFMIRAEKRFVKKALELANWNRKKAAEILEISYKSLLNKMKEFGLK